MHLQHIVLNLIEDLGEHATTYNIAHTLGVSFWQIERVIADWLRVPHDSPLMPPEPDN